MRRRAFIRTTALLGAACLAAPVLLTRPARASAVLRLAASDPAAAHAVAAHLAAASEGTLILAPVPAGTPADAALVEAWRLSPAAALLAAMPFGPEPERLAPWLASDEGRALFRAAAGSAAFAVALAPGGHVAGPVPDGLADLRGLRVAAPGPLGKVWRRLGAETAAAEAPVTDCAAAGGRLGFGPRSRLLALSIDPGALAALPPSARPALESPPLLLDGPAGGPSLSPEIMVAAGNHAADVRRALKASADRLTARIAAALPAPAVSGIAAACWPWPAASNALVA
ncbi:MAG TPA: hypothetical protein VED40_19520 [Azospirillaceae bacterium]|nr:hypothetical protein [Azospirillaceae bacterium]